ncbi:hypothetical protein QWM81_25980 [Streptomyces ficellus]|uniref:DUF3558 domain-containing protein n=1 Tax=Streptomyces ficellus TaxID=1977088 RepID=A0ABT7ZDA7_9ACTN|nr:hypothetical protein [Streptomyces ficellus]MDN3297428.1 hypothetical protein [Streptomyces ficellus]
MKDTLPMRSTRFLRAAPVAIAAFVATGILTGCSQEQGGEAREYTVPSSLCGVPVAADLLSPFLPPGSAVSANEEDPVGGVKRCEITVDDEPAVTASMEWREKNERLSEVALDHERVDLTKYESSGTYLYSATGAVGRVDGCRNPKFTGDMFTVVETHGAEYKDKEAMRKLIVAYTGSVQKGDECHRA